MQLVLKNGVIIQDNQEITADIVIEKGKIVEITANAEAENIIDCHGCYVFPSFIDLHVHFREPGQTYKENIESGLKAALRGGYTAVCAMANTNPVIDNVDLLRNNIEKGQKFEGDYYQIAACTKGLQGREFVDFPTLKKAGAIAFSDDGMPIADGTMFKELLQRSQKESFLVIEHCEDQTLDPTNPRSEINMIYRNLELLQLWGGNLHLAHISCGESIELIEQAKKAKLNVSCEISPHHLLLNRSTERKLQGNAKMNPPLRGKEDNQRLLAALNAGVVDCIATDHAPHAPAEKELSFNKALRGVIGLETAFPLLWDFLINQQGWSIKALIELFTSKPLKILKLHPVVVAKNAVANLTVFDPHQKWQINQKQLLSKSRNTPFINQFVQGGVRYVLYQGQLCFNSDNLRWGDFNNE